MQWLIRRGKHIRPETVSEYLDGRLSPADAARVEAHLTTCARCQEELASLRQTVRLLHRLPQIEPSRSFVLLETPAPARPALQVPAWAYGAVASAFALAFAVILSMDVGGLLAPSIPSGQQTFQMEALPTPAPAGDKEAPAFKPPLPTSPARAVGEEGAVLQVTPTSAPPAKEIEPAEEAAPPPVVVEQEGTSWVWRLAEGLLALSAVAAVGAYLLRRRGWTLSR